MPMTPGLRKFALTTHVLSSVGWLGAVTCFLALAVAGLASQDAQRVRAAYLAMELTAWFVIVPLSLASPVTGIAMSLGTTWGLFRHYWVLAKLVITIPASIVLLLHMQPIGHLAGVAAERTLASGEIAGLRIQLVANAGAALLVLLAATALSVYKPWGRTRDGRRTQQECGDAVDHAAAGSDRSLRRSTPRWVCVVGILLIVLALLFVILHLTGGGLGRHGPG